jgi:hypothetical protein
LAFETSSVFVDVVAVAVVVVLLVLVVLQVVVLLVVATLFGHTHRFVLLVELDRMYNLERLGCTRNIAPVSSPGNSSARK